MRLSLSKGAGTYLMVCAALNVQGRIAPMRFQLTAARLAFASLVLAVLTAAGAVAGVRSGALSDAAASTLMIPATLLGVVALLLALLWTRAALHSNLGAGKRLGLTALIGALLFLYQP